MKSLVKNANSSKSCKITTNKNFKLIGVIDKNKKKLKKIEDCYSNVKLEKKTLENTDLIVLSVPTDTQYKYVKKILNL